MKPVVVSQIQSRYVNLEKFDGKVGEWGNWYDQFEFLAIHYNWDDRERLVRLVSCLKGPALTAHRSFSQTARNTYALCIAALHERYGSRKPALIVTLRAELSTVRQEEGESMEMFGCGVYALTNQAYPDLVNAPTLLQSHAVPAFLKGLRERNAAQEAMKFPNPKSIQEAAVTITHIQGASRVFGIIDAVSLKDPVYIGCQCYKRRVYQESNGDPACPYHGAQETPTYYYHLRVKLLEVETGTVLWLSFFDEIMAQFVRIDACEFDDLSHEKTGRVPSKEWTLYFSTWLVNIMLPQYENVYVSISLFVLIYSVNSARCAS